MISLIKPIGKRVLLKERVKKSSKRGLLFLNEPVEKDYIVVALGSGDFDVKIGDVVLPEKYSMNPVKIDEEEYFLINADQIIGIFEEIESEQLWFNKHLLSEPIGEFAHDLFIKAESQG